MDTKAIRLLKKILQANHGKKIILYKGLDLSLHYYRQKNVRSYRDLDLLVRKKDYNSIKKAIALIPGVLLLSQESKLGNALFGHAFFYEPTSGLYVELHISKNPKNIWEYVSGKEYNNIFKNLHKKKLFYNYTYYSLARTEYLGVIVRQFIKALAMGPLFLNYTQLKTFVLDFSLIITQMTTQDWAALQKKILEKKTFMRFYTFSLLRVWYFFFLAIKTEGILIHEKTLPNISTQLSNKEVYIIKNAVKDFANNQIVPKKYIFSKPRGVLWIIRVLIFVLQMLFFKSRQKILIC